MFSGSALNGEERGKEESQFCISCLSFQALPGADMCIGPSLVTGVYIISTERYALPSYLLVHSPLCRQHNV